jgi:hypothetical protein
VHRNLPSRILVAKSAVALRPGEVKETVTQERIVPVEEEQHAAGYGMDVFDYMASLSEAEWTEHILYLYRKYPPPQSGAKRTNIDILTHAIDERWLKEKHGGGVYHYILKKGSQRIKEGDTDEIAGPPKDASASPSSNNDSDLVRIVEMLKKDAGVGTPQAAMALQMEAFSNALAIQRASVPAQMTLKDLTEAMRNLQGLNGGGGSGMPSWLEEVGKLAAPALVALLMKVLEPKDPLTTLKGVGETLSVLKGLSGGTEKSSFLTELGRNAPMLLSEGSKFLAEMRASAQLQQQNTALARLPASQPPPVMPAVHAEPARPAPAAIPAAPTQVVDQSAIEAGRPSPEWVFGQIVKMCQDGQPGGVAFDFLDQIDPEFTKMLLNVTIDQLRTAIETDTITPVLKQMGTSPNFEKFLAEFCAAVKESAEDANKPPLPN